VATTDVATSQARAHSHPNYMGVFWALLILTIIEVGLSYTSLPRTFYVVLLVVLAFVKASLVGLYYMHLKFERPAVGVIFASMLLLTFLLISIGIAEKLL